MNAAEQESFAAAIYDVVPEGRLFFALGEAELQVPRGKIAATLTALRDAPLLRMAQLVDLAVVDYPERAARFDVVYQLLSLSENKRLRVIVQTDEQTPVTSVIGVYPSAGWFEREAYDLFGVVFEGHPDLRRLLTDYGFEGHPLRRDFPLMGFVQVRYDDVLRSVVHEPLTLQQDYRALNAMSPWVGMTDVQKRTEGQE